MLAEYTWPYIKPYLKPYLTSALTHLVTLATSFHLNLLTCVAVDYLIDAVLGSSEKSTFVTCVVVNISLSALYDRLYALESKILNMDRAAQFVLDNAGETMWKVTKWCAIGVGLTYVWVALLLIRFDNRVLAIYTVQYITSTVIYETMVKTDGDYSVLYRWLQRRRGRPIVRNYAPLAIRENYLALGDGKGGEDSLKHLSGSIARRNSKNQLVTQLIEESSITSLPKSTSTNQLILCDGWLTTDDYLE
jgi:hypothetical protein